MATVAEREACLEALRRSATAWSRVSYDGRTVDCRGTAETARAIPSREEPQLQADAAGAAPGPSAEAAVRQRARSREAAPARARFAASAAV